MSYPYKIVTDREQALQRENERLTDQAKRQSATIHVQAVAIQSMTEEIEASERNLEQLTDELAQSRAALKAQPVQPVRFERVKGETFADWQKNISKEFYAYGDCVLCWVNEGDIYASIFRPVATPVQPVQPASFTLAEYPEKCPITRRPFFMVIEHPDLGMVPTYGGPFDSYTIPHMLGEADEQMHERELECHRYDHDGGAWVDDEIIPLRVIHDDFLPTEDEAVAQPVQEPVQEPVVWDAEDPTADELETFRRAHWMHWNAADNLLISHLVAKLRCAAPVQPAPLSDAQIDKLISQNLMARAIEAAVRTGGAG